MVATKAIVINAIKYAESSLIVTCYTKEFGIKKYLLKGILKAKRAKLKTAYFYPLMQLKLIANHNYKGHLNYIKEAEITNHYQQLYTQIKKQTIALFIAEMLYLSLKEEEENKTLFKYLETSLLWLDTQDNITNFHLLFLLNLTKYLGFYPEIKNKELPYFNLLEGRFESSSTSLSISKEKLNSLKMLLGINFDALHTIEFNSQSRQEILTVLIQYFELHLSGFKKPKSLNVLQSVFH